MTVRAVEGKKPYTGGKAIEITEDKVINLRLRAENNLIIYDEGDDEIYVDLQLPDGIEPLDTFPVGITTGRVLVDDDWDVNGTIVCFKTTSGDNIKLLYGDDGKLYIDNGTGLFKQIYLKGEVDALLLALRQYVDQQLALKQDKLIAGENIVIAADGKTISAMIPPLARFLSIWDCETGLPDSFPSATLPFEYITGDHYIVGTVDTTNTPPVNYRPDGIEFDGTASTVVESADVQPGDVYIYDGSQWLLQVNHDKVVTFAQIAGQPSDNTNLATALNAKQDTLTAGANITIDQNNEISATDTTYSAGNGINIDANDEISVDTSVVATQTDINGVIKQGNNTVTSNISLNRSSTEKIVIGRTGDGAGITITEGSGNQQQYIEYENGWIDVKTPGNALKSYNFDNSNTGVVRFQDLSGKQDKLTASTGISIDANNNISNSLPGAIVSSTAPSNASQGDLWYDTTSDQLNSYDGSSWNPVDVDTTYTAGNGINIDANDEISVDTSVVATQTDLDDYLAKDNTTAFTPSGDYNPATKKYVDDELSEYKGFLVINSLPTVENANENLIYALRTASGCEMYVVDEVPNAQTFDRSFYGSYYYDPNHLDLSESATITYVNAGVDSGSFLGFMIEGEDVGYFDNQGASSPAWYSGTGWYKYENGNFVNIPGNSVVVPAGHYTIDSGPGDKSFLTITVNVGTTKAWKKIGETNADLSNYFNMSTNDTDDITEGTTNKFILIDSSDPSSPVQGTVYYNTTDDKLYSYDGVQWNEVGGGGGDVVGPSSATDGHLAVFDGATGKLIKDGGVIPVGLSSQAGNVFTSGMTIWGGSSSDYSSLTPAPNTAYLII